MYRQASDALATQGQRTVSIHGNWLAFHWFVYFGFVIDWCKYIVDIRFPDRVSIILSTFLLIVTLVALGAYFSFLAYITPVVDDNLPKKPTGRKTVEGI